MTSKKAPAPKNPLLDEMERTITAELKKFKTKDDATPLLDRMRVWDRALKIAALRMKVDDDGFGSGFASTED